ncbi:VACUOLAR PROTEIN SORTING-ASSOCIATED PROTEIN VTA1-like protein [Salix viminalis]|uniref:VACUOLAR PROTEIN SORTING-ASSOCIATED PROTEIN VTA1-like protein n=1 Tax=Salix viminalis TaxID=40686 RepID=A0A9Q0U7F1_SALVM|nr:VACUOLAR PROTEIN SORTING-ASSOCIATED PROTEIN VTA1-like protein [Salix viminalis]
MGSENEPAKLLLPYLQRADELQKHEALVAYYCRLYAMEKGLRIPQNERTKTTNSLLISLMKQLEKAAYSGCAKSMDKKSLKLGPEDNLYLEGFALNVFGKADKQDRAGRADLSTAKTFYAASIFFEIITQFGELQPDLEQKQKYAVWKAADIRKALKEGRKPNPGPPVDDENLSIPSSTPSGVYDLGRSESAASNAHPESDPPPQFHDQVNDEQYTNIPPSPLFHDKTPLHLLTLLLAILHMIFIHLLQQADQRILHMLIHLLQQADQRILHMLNHTTNNPTCKNHHTTNNPTCKNHHTTNNPTCKSHHTTNNPTCKNLNHISHIITNLMKLPSYSYPNFQSYPSFSESSLPSVPSQHPSYYQGSDPSHIPQSAPPTSSYSSTPQYPSSSIKRTNSDPAPTPAKTYQYDSNYCPPPDKIAEAHKAARFAVGALAFDDVSVAVDYLRKSLELLTNPSVGHE